jgi:hypothetical protein
LSARLFRRDWLRGALAGGTAALSGALRPREVAAFGEEGAFNPRALIVGDAKWEGVRASAPSRWADEVVRRTSAPGRLRPTKVRADAPELLAEPFVFWGGSQAVPPLISGEINGLRRFFAMGGVLFVDDFDPESGAFGKSAKRELARVLPEQTPIAIGTENVVFRSFYLLKRAEGRVLGPEKLEGIVRGGVLQVVISSHDVLGALARDPSGASALEVTPGGEDQRELAIRLAVNVALYVLCSNYKDDQVHAELIMRRRGGSK